MDFGGHRKTTTAPSGDVGDVGRAAGDSNTDRAVIPAAANACLVLSLASGVGLLVWWSVVFHPSDRQLWMVPVSLVMAGTPLMVWLSVFRLPSGCCTRRLCRELKQLFVSPPESALVLPDPDPEK